MNREINEALEAFASLLPDYLPAGPGNPNDLNRWYKVCYLSVTNDYILTEEAIIDTIRKHHSGMADKCIAETAHNYYKEYEDTKPMLEYLKQNGLLVTNKKHQS